MERNTYKFYKIDKDKKGVLVTLDQTKIVHDDCEGESYISENKVTLIHEDQQRIIGKFILKSHLGHVIENKFNYYEECNEKNMREKYLRLKKANIPVPKTFRVDESKHKFLMTDLTNNGEKIIFDKHYPDSNNFIINFDEIKNQVKNIALTAYKNGIFLSLDAYCVVVDKKTKIGKVFILDFGMNSLIIENNTNINLDYKEEAIKESDYFLECLIKH